MIFNLKQFSTCSTYFYCCHAPRWVDPEFEDEEAVSREVETEEEEEEESCL